VFALDHFESANAAAYVNAHTFRVIFRDLQTGTSHRVDTRRDTHLDKAAHLLDVFLVDEPRGIEVLDLACDPAVEQRGIEGFNARNAVAAFEQGFPRLLRGVANRGQQTDAGDYNSAGNNRSPLNAWSPGHNPRSRPGERILGNPIRGRKHIPLDAAIRPQVATFPGRSAPGSTYFFLPSM
jgi:hypothetical protein